MRTSQLRALLRELRAGGVSEYQSTKRGETLVLKLGAPIPVELPATKRAPAKAAAQPFPPVSSELRKQLEELGVNVEDASEVLASVGLGASHAS